MGLLKSIQNKPKSTRYIILIISVSLVMVFIIYFWFISFSSYLNDLSKNKELDKFGSLNKGLELLSLKDSLKASVNDFWGAFSNIIDKIDDQNSYRASDFDNLKNLGNDQNQKNVILKFPDNY